MKNSLILIAIILAIVTNATAQDLIEKTQQNNTYKNILKNTKNPNPLAKLVTQNRINAKTSTAVDVFNFSNSKSEKVAQKVLKSIELTLDETAINRLLREKQSFLNLKIPVNESNYFELELVRNNFQTPNYKVSTSKSKAEPYQKAEMLFYKGIIKNDNQSLAAVSITNNQIRILASDTSGNYVVGKVPDSNSKYVLYNDVNLKNDPQYTCETPEEPEENNVDANTAGNTVISGECVPIYIEADFAFFQNNGSSVENVEVYLNSLFNEVETIYFNESIGVTISEIFVHTEAGPFVTSINTADALGRFRALRQNNFSGRLGHLISGRTLGGGRAGIDVLCSVNRNHAVSALDGFFNTFPMYSWDLYVFAHEMGHNFGSRHTHACAWNGNNTAIDSCDDFTEGSCSLPGIPAEGGTIMSYCHQNSTGINFSLGFGQQPGDLIRSRFNNSSCILECEASCNYAGNPCNFIPNSTFDTNTDTWILNNVNATSEKGICKIEIINEGTNPWDAAMYSAELCLVKDVNYEVSFDAYSDSIKYFTVKMALNEEPWDLYHYEEINLTTNFQNYSFPFTNTFSSTSVARMELQLGGVGNAADVYIDNIVLRPEECIGLNICEQVENGNFEDGFTNWQSWGMDAPQIISNECYLNQITPLNEEFLPWNAAVAYRNLNLEQNKVYNIQFDARADSLRRLNLKVGLGEEPFTNYLYETIHLTNQMETYRYTFTLAAPSISNVSFEFQVGESTIPVIIDNVSFVENNCETANYSNTCIENVNLEGEPDVNIYHAGQNINSKAIIPQGINVSYFSGDNILLYDGFDVSPKADFNAAIKNCGEE